MKMFFFSLSLFFFFKFDCTEDEDEDGEAKMPSCGDYVLHFLTLFWKILFAFVPPTGQLLVPLFFYSRQID